MTLKNPKILVVDDSPSIVKFVRSFLPEFDRIEAAENGEAGVEAFLRESKGDDPYRLIFMDIEMPRMNGIEALKKIRGAEKEQGVKDSDRVPIIMLTSVTDRILDAAENDASDYLVKPFQPSDLTEKLKKFKLAD